MSELFPMEALAVPGASRRVTDVTPVKIAERRPGSFVEVSLWSEVARQTKAIAKVTGCKAMPEPGRMVSSPGYTILSAGPARYFAIGQEPGLAGRLAQSIKATDGAVVDITHGRTGLRLTGPASEALLQKGFSFDLSASEFPPGATTTGAIHHMAVTTVRIDDEAFDLFAMSSFAGSLWDWVTDAAVEFGWQVGSPIN